MTTPVQDYSDAERQRLLGRISHFFRCHILQRDVLTEDTIMEKLCTTFYVDPIKEASEARATNTTAAMSLQIPRNFAATVSPTTSPMTLTPRTRATQHQEDVKSLLCAFRDVENLPKNWNRDTRLDEWDGISRTYPGTHFKCALGHKRLKGTVDLTCLPSRLVTLSVSGNSLSGEVDLTKLPRKMTELYLNDNEFEGGIDLTKLPEDLEFLNLQTNKFRQSYLDLTKLPSKLNYLLIHENDFSGPLRLENLPHSLSRLWAMSNRFSGPLSLKDLPPFLAFLNLECNCLEGELPDFSDLPVCCTEIQLASNNFSGSLEDVKGIDKLPDALEILDVSRNPKLTGNFDKSKLSKCLQKKMRDGDFKLLNETA